MAENTLLEKVLSLRGKFQSIQDQLSDPSVMSDMKKYVQLNKDYKELEPIIKAGQDYKRLLDNLQSAKDILLNEKDEVFTLRGISLRAEIGCEGADVSAYERAAGLAHEVLLVCRHLIAGHLA